VARAGQNHHPHQAEPQNPIGITLHGFKAKADPMERAETVVVGSFAVFFIGGFAVWLFERQSVRASTLNTSDPGRIFQKSFEAVHKPVLATSQAAEAGGRKR
jgi:hypothetical protein